MNASPPTTFMGFMGRILWLFFGPLALMMVLMGIVQTGEGWLTGFDIAFFVILVAMVLGRALEFASGAPQTADGTPATPGHLFRYMIWMPATALAFWVVANFFANR
jgi:hypothetical protein